MYKTGAMLLLIAVVVGCDMQSSFTVERVPKPNEQAASPLPAVEINPLSVVIERPTDYVDDDVYDGMRWAVTSGTVPSGSEFVVFARTPRAGFFHMTPPPLRAGKNASGADVYQQDNVRLATTGAWTLHVAVADRQALAALDARVARGDFAALGRLPAGIVEIAHVQIERR